MGMPSISITFTELATSVVKRGERGIIAIILKDETVPETNPFFCNDYTDIPAELNQDNQEQIKLAMKGYINTPQKIICYVIDNESKYEDALKYFKMLKFDYLVAPAAQTDNVTETIATYVKNERKNKKLIKAVLPDTKSDHEAIVNYTTKTVTVGEKVYTTEQYCSRIAGILAGTPLKISATYAPLSELDDCSRLEKQEMDAAVDNGEFIVWWDGEKVKTGRAVNSLTTLTDEKNTQFQKIKVTEIMDMIANDLRMTIEDSYIGKYSNGYQNKSLLVSAISDYLYQLKEKEELLNDYTIEIDVEKNRSYLKARGKDVDKMNDDEIKKANTGSNVFLKSTLGILDAIEDVELPIAI